MSVVTKTERFVRSVATKLGFTVPCDYDSGATKLGSTVPCDYNSGSITQVTIAFSVVAIALVGKVPGCMASSVSSVRRTDRTGLFTMRSFPLFPPEVISKLKVYLIILKW
jgi:hypothetical protein